MVAPYLEPRSDRVYGPSTPTGTIQFVAPQIGGAATPTFESGSDNISAGFNIASVVNGSHFGGRLAFSSTQDFSSRKWFLFRSDYSTFGLFDKFAALSSGGVSTIFYDTSGNWAEYYWHGGAWQNRDGTVGGWQHFTSDARSASVLIDITASADAASGVVDFSQIAGVEFHCRFAASASTVRIHFGLFSVSSGWQILGGEALNEASLSVADVYASTASNSFTYYQAFRSLTKNYDGQIGSSYSCRGDISVGNGSDETIFFETGFSLSFYPTRDNNAGATSSTTIGSMPHVVAPSSSRFFTVNQSATDDVTFRDARWSGYDTAGGDWSWQCIGSTSGNCEVISCQIFRAGRVVVGHSTQRGVTYSDCDQVEINLNSLVTSSRIASSSGKGLYVTGGAGDYSANTIALEDEVASVHVTIADNATGTYDLTGLSDVGQTVVFHNESASSAITIQVNEDFGPTSTTTAGGAITIEVVAPPSVASVSNIIDGSRLRIYNVTQDVETFNGVISGATEYTANYTTGTDYGNGDVIRVYLTYQSGVTAKLGFQATAVASSAGWSVLADQQDDEVYNLNAIDGSAVTKFAADYVDDEIDISAASNFSSQEFYAWFVSTLTTEQGIRNFFGGYVAEDAANYRNNVATVSIYWDNLTTTNVYQTDSARIYRSDGQRPVKNGGATTGGGGVDLNWREKVFLATTGGGPLTPTQEARLLSCATEAKQDTIISDIADLPANIDTQLSATHGPSSWETGAGGGGDDAATIYSYFTDGVRADAFKATGFSTFDPLTTSVTVSAIENNVITASTIANNAFTNSAFTTGYYNTINSELDAALADYDAPTKAELDAGLAALQAHGDTTWQTATGFSTFNPATDTVARVALVDVCTENADMRGTDGANTVAPDNATISSISATVELLRKYHDNESVFLAADQSTKTTQSLAYYTVVYDDDGVTPLKTVMFTNSAGSATPLPNATGYEKL